jgi:hypothetical protein
MHIPTTPAKPKEKHSRERLIPYRLLAYLLYAEDAPWIAPVGKRTVRLFTGDAARTLKLKVSLLWEALYWLKKAGLVESVAKEEKRGMALIVLKAPTKREVPSE